MKFRYPLQKLVDLKSNEKEQAEWLLSEAIVVLNEEQEAMRRLEGEQSEAMMLMEHAALHSSSVARMQELQQYVLYTEQQIQLKSGDVSRAQSDVDERRQCLNGKMKEEQVWNKAREKARQQFAALMLKKEQEELDEMALNRRARMI